MSAAIFQKRLAAFSREWERLGTPAQRLGMRHGAALIVTSRHLKRFGFIESRMASDCLRWRLTQVGIDALANAQAQQ